MSLHEDAAPPWGRISPQEVFVNPSRKSSSQYKAVVGEPDFEDVISINRGLPVVEALSVPRPPLGYRATDPDVRNRRLRKLAAEHRAEAMDALQEASERFLEAELGSNAPDQARAEALRERLVQTGGLVVAAQALLNYAKELDQIAMSDAVRFLEEEHRALLHALPHEPALATHYPALTALFAALGEKATKVA
jgi:hypothetical protein